VACDSSSIVTGALLEAPIVDYQVPKMRARIPLIHAWAYMTSCSGPITIHRNSVKRQYVGAVLVPCMYCELILTACESR
jgi:hypothetical protein